MVAGPWLALTILSPPLLLCPLLYERVFYHPIALPPFLFQPCDALFSLFSITFLLLYLIYFSLYCFSISLSLSSLNSCFFPFLLLIHCWTSYVISLFPFCALPPLSPCWLSSCLRAAIIISTLNYELYLAYSSDKRENLRPSIWTQNFIYHLL